MPRAASLRGFFFGDLTSLAAVANASLADRKPDARPMFDGPFEDALRFLAAIAGVEH
jgi:hypothetical protein